MKRSVWKLVVLKMGMNKIRKMQAEFDCPFVLSEEFVAVEDIVYTAPILTDKDLLEFVQSSKNIVDADSDEENE
ncbi:hypothetical protein TNCV_1469711 [Trichonephila clavipes]|nr:hypothetical protein TNCV_1469711 [Trichonephila clavipes]